MIAKNELQNYCRIMGFNLGQVEKDYLQHLFLIFLSRKLSNELVFKGGTALQKVYGLNRFSIDLDFSQTAEIDFVELINTITKNITDFGYVSRFEEIKTLGRTFKIRIHGPLYNNSQISASSLIIEISQRENILLEPQSRQITPIYNDLQPYSLLVMQESEILAEKVRAIIARNKPKDIFDLHFLIKKGIKFNTALVNKKLAYYKEKYSRKRFTEKIKEKEPIWNKELRNYMQTVPDFKIVVKEIIEAIKI